MIFFHELGHFLIAKASGVKVLEFTIGFGPAILKKQVGDTLYALRIIPFGGAVMMEGEDEDSNAEGSFQNAPVLNKFLIIIAGATMNIIMGFIIVFFWVLPKQTYTEPQIAEILEPVLASEENVFMPGDIIKKVDDYSVWIYSDIATGLSLNEGEYHDFDIIRDGKKMHFSDVKFVRGDYEIDGQIVNCYGYKFLSRNASFLDKIKLSFYRGVNFVRLVFVSLEMLIFGRAGIGDLSGPVAITATISDVAKQSMSDAWYLIALVSVNLGVMNLLPLPALDGGRLIFIIIEAIRRKPVNPKYEGYIHMIGLFLFMALFVFVTFNDIYRLVASMISGG